MKTQHNAVVTLLLALSALALAPAPLHAAAPTLSSKDKHQMEDEQKQGQQVADQVAKQEKFVTDKAQIDRINQIGQRLAAVANSGPYPAQFGNDHTYPFTWTFHIIKDKDVNAFSLPGGYVYVNAGLMSFVKSDDELAGVLAHEITHAAHHHMAAISHEQSKMNAEMALGLIAALLAHVPPQDIGNLSTGAQYAQMGILNNKYSEAAERDADHGGTLLMERAGFNPVGMLTFMQRLAEQERRSPNVELGILRDHPFTTERLGLISAELSQMNVPVTPRTVRQVSGAARVTVKPLGSVRELDFGSQSLATLADPDGDRAVLAAARINALLDQGLQLYQVKAISGDLVANDRAVLTFTPADAALHTGSSAETLAADASRALRAGLWAQTISGNTTSYAPLPVAQ